jgi:hypothetical protein
MGAIELVLHLRTSGFSISAENFKLQISPAQKLTAELKQSISKCKTDILCSIRQEDELKRLVLLVSKRCGFSKEDYEEALHHALNNPVNAIACFMELERQTNQITSVEVKI